MDASIQAVMLGVVSNVLTMFLLSPFKRGEQRQSELLPIIQEAIEEVAETFEWTGTPRIEEVCLFLTSPEVEAVIRQVFSVKLSESKVQNIELIRQEFVALFSAHFELKKGKILNQAGELFTILLEGTEKALDAAIDKEILSGHEAKSVVRYRQLIDEIAVVQKNLDFLTSKHRPNLKAIFEFEEKYREQVSERHGRITPPNFDSARKLPIDDIYVAPNFLDFCKPNDGSSTENEQRSLDLKQFLAKIYRAILLGNPGGGKSTLTNKLCFDLAHKYTERPLAGRELTPVPVILRDYGSEKKARNCSILQFIELTANSTYQVQPPVGAFEYLLLNGRVVVIFDGLDELLETSYRQKITADVESFCNLYPSVPVLVTSREVGYEQAPLDEKKFEAYRLAPFKDEQVAEYVTKWFLTDTELTPVQQQNKAQSFIKESRIVPDLRSNPLMLALMCNIYRGENYIPQNRPDLYEKCAVMLFERWDKTRGIIPTLPFEAHIRPAMMYLAHWIYTNDALQSGVEENKLVNKTADYLLERLYEDRDEAEMAARNFIEFCKGRAWVFTDTGAGLYQFTHRTFLEYFTAFHLVRIHSTPDSLIGVLIGRIEKREWDIVSQLAIQLLNRHSEAAGDEILTVLVDTSTKTDITEAKGWNLISFAARCLQFIVPNSAVRKNITTVCLERFIEFGRYASDSLRYASKYRNWPYSPQVLEETLAVLLTASSENQATIARSVKDFLTTTINSTNDTDASLALEIVTYLPYPIGNPHFAEPNPGNFSYWVRLSEKVYNECITRINELVKTNRFACTVAFWRREIDVKDFINWHGVDNLFTAHHYRIFPMIWTPATQLIGAAIGNSSLSHYEGHQPNKARIEYDRKQLGILGSILLTTPTPWYEGKQEEFLPINTYILSQQLFPDKTNKKERPLLEADTIFGAFIVIAAGLEALAPPRGRQRLELSKSIRHSKAFLFDTIRLTFMARFTPTDEAQIQAEFDRSRFNSKQQELVWQWIRKEVDFIKLLPQPRSRKKSGAKKSQTSVKARKAKK
jgi:hypothetical protein